MDISHNETMPRRLFTWDNFVFRVKATIIAGVVIAAIAAMVGTLLAMHAPPGEWEMPLFQWQPSD